MISDRDCISRIKVFVYVAKNTWGYSIAWFVKCREVS